MSASWEQRAKRFLSELSILSRETGIVVIGCGCHGSPWIEDYDLSSDERYTIYEFKPRSTVYLVGGDGYTEPEIPRQVALEKVAYLVDESKKLLDREDVKGVRGNLDEILHRLGMLYGPEFHTTIPTIVRKETP